MPMIKIYGLTKEQCLALEQLALQKIDKKSVSLLAKQLLLDALNNVTSETSVHTKKRTEIRLNTNTKNKLQQLAAQENMSLNRYIVMLLNNHVETKKIMSRTQLQALRESNYQLFQMGKNINQIAKALNQGLPATVSSTELEKIYRFIDKHTDEVMEVIANTPSL